MEKFVVVSNGVKLGKQYSILRLIREGQTKQSGEPYAFIDEKSFMREDESFPIGTILRYERRRVDNKLTANKALEQ